MFNRDGVHKAELTGPKQILANVDMQAAVGCIVATSMVTTANADGKKIAKAGTPLNVNLSTRDATPAVLATATVAMNAVLLHDVDVTFGNANATALLFGFVNTNRCDTDTQALITTAVGNASASKLIVFLKA